MSKLVTVVPLSVPYVRFVKFEEETGDTDVEAVIPKSPLGISPPTVLTVSQESLFSESAVEITLEIPAKVFVSLIPFAVWCSGVTLPWLDSTLLNMKKKHTE